jgi:hypothetical protein
MDNHEWPVESEREFSEGGVTCPCGQKFHLYWNGGELDSHECVCGRFYATEHRSTVLVVRSRP